VEGVSVGRLDATQSSIGQQGVAVMNDGELEVSVVIPCLNEHETIGVCVQKAVGALAQSGLSGEVIVAENGSTDGSVEIAESVGARVIPVRSRGYGNALRGGIEAARGRYVIMGDADDSYQCGPKQ
jgi:glycosyltransferase involved in cell wall biosynthesis